MGDGPSKKHYFFYSRFALGLQLLGVYWYRLFPCSEYLFHLFRHRLYDTHYTFIVFLDRCQEKILVQCVLCITFDSCSGNCVKSVESTVYLCSSHLLCIGCTDACKCLETQYTFYKQDIMEPCQSYGRCNCFLSSFGIFSLCSKL